MMEVARDRPRTENISDFSTERRKEAYGSVTRVVIGSSTLSPERVQLASTWMTTAEQRRGYLSMPPPTTVPHGDGSLPVVGVRPGKGVAVATQDRQASHQGRALPSNQRRSEFVDERQRVVVAAAADVVSPSSALRRVSPAAHQQTSAVIITHAV